MNTVLQNKNKNQEIISVSLNQMNDTYVWDDNNGADAPYRNSPITFYKHILNDVSIKLQNTLTTIAS